MPNDLTPTSSWSSTQTRAQYAAIAKLRWRIFVNQFRRKGGTGELIGQIITYPIAAIFAFIPVVGSGGLAWYITAFPGKVPINLALLFWITFALAQFLNIQLGQPGTTFDPTQLIRFPLSVRSYIATRLFFGLLAPSNIIVVLMSFSMALGISIAEPSLALVAFAALFVFAATNIIFTRMIFAWVDRWLSTRRAREVFTALIFVFSLGIQWANVTFNPAYTHNKSIPSAKIHAMTALYNRAHPFIAALPPELISASVTAAAQRRPIAATAEILGCAAWGALFLSIFAYRTRTEFRGEAFSDVANAVAPPTKPGAPRPDSRTWVPTNASLVATNNTTAAPAPNTFGLSSILLGLMAKDILAIRRNTGLFMSVIAPIFFVLLFAGKLGMKAGGFSIYVFPSALAYTLMGIAPLAYNSFGLEGAGAQFYFIAPLSMRDVFLAKNLLNFTLAAIEGAVVLVIITLSTGMPTLQITVATYLWAIATLLLNTSIGNRRSITAPKKVDLGRAAAKQASPLSALISLGVLLVCGATGAGFLILASKHSALWTLPPIMGILAAASLIFYRRDLTRLDAFALAHRDELFEELCKK